MTGTPSATRPGAAFWLLAAASVQAALLAPYVVLVPGERTNLFSPLLMLLPALALLPGAKQCWFGRSFACWTALAAGFTAVSLAGPEPIPALLRAFAFVAPAASGLFCAWRLFSDPGGRRAFLHLLSLCFAALCAAWLLFRGTPHFAELHHHALTGTLVLLAAGPISLLRDGRRGLRALGAALLALGFVLCLAAGSRYLAVLPLALIPLAWGTGRIGRTPALLGLAAALVLAAAFFQAKPDKVPRVNNYESTFYRLEGIPASLTILARHPLAGIGIRTERAALLADYEPVLGMADKASFLAVVGKNVTADNQYLSLPVGVGLPLALLYFGLIWRLVRRYRTGALRDPARGAAELAPAIPLAATLLHFCLYDGLFYPQISWFFHLLLGLGAFAAPGGEAAGETGGPEAAS